jgi:hypothetical protein
MKARWISLFLLPLAAILLTLLLGLLSPASGSESVILAEYLPTPRPTEPCDICEPNNSLEQACGPLESGTSYQYPIRCTTPRDQDYYYIDLEATGTVTLDLTSIPSGTDYSIYLYDENKTLRCRSDQHGNQPEHVTCILSQLGRYYVRVYPWTGCSEDDPYTLTVTYPTPTPTPVPTSTPTPLCNLHIDDFGDTDPKNDLGKPSGWERDPPSCGTFDVFYNAFELQLDYDLTSPSECTARYTTTLLLDASPYETLAFEIMGNDKEELLSTVIGLSDEAGYEKRVKVGDFLHQAVMGTWQEGVNLPLAAFATEVDTTQLDTFFIEFDDTQGASQGTIYLDRLRLERTHAPLTVDNFDDQTDPNALGGGTGIFTGTGATLETAYITNGTYDNSSSSYAISYTLPLNEWALWETYLLGLDVSHYNSLSFYIKGADGGEKVNLYLEDGQGKRDYVDVETYVPIATDWTLVRVPLQDFEGVALTDLAKIKFVFEWEPMTGTIFLDDLRFVAGTLLVDSFCDNDENNSLNERIDTFTSAPSCTATVASSVLDGTLCLDYDVTAGPGCYSGYWSRTPLDLNPYRTLAVKVRGESCGEVAAISARTVPVETDKLKLSDYLLDGITDQWQKARIPLAASAAVTDWTRGDSYVIAFEAGKGASMGTTCWDDVAFETACAPLWVDNFNDEDNVNALLGSSNVSGWEAEITSTTYITQAYGDVGAGLVLSYAVPAGSWAYWETGLRNVNLSNYDRLVLHIKSAAGGEKPNIRLRDGDNKEGVLNIEEYVALSTQWQEVVIPLEDFGVHLDYTRIQALKVVIEWDGTGEGTLFLDDIRFLPSESCSQITQKQVFLPMTAKDYRPWPTPLPLDPVWDFESDTEGWTYYKTYTPSLAVVGAETSTFRSRWGDASLAMIVNLIGGHPNFSKGVAYIDLEKYPPPGITAPLDLECKPLSCWLYVPTCGLGDPAEPNYVRFRLKDENGKWERSGYTPVVRNQWFELRLRPSTVAPYGGSMDPGFDPHRIIKVEVEFGTHSQGITYRGKVYLDACGWQEIDPVSAASVEACLPEDKDRMPPPLPRSEE